MGKSIGSMILLSLSVALLTVACSSSAAPVTPAADRPTLLYFYTDN